MKSLRKWVLVLAASTVMFGGTVIACAPAQAAAPVWVYEKWFHAKISGDTIGEAFWEWVIENWD